MNKIIEDTLSEAETLTDEQRMQLAARLVEMCDLDGWKVAEFMMHISEAQAGEFANLLDGLLAAWA